MHAQGYFLETPAHPLVPRGPTTEAAAGFPAFHYGERGDREIDFVALRRAVAEGRRFDPALAEEVLPPSARAGHAAERREPAVPAGDTAR